MEKPYAVLMNVLRLGVVSHSDSVTFCLAKLSKMADFTGVGVGRKIWSTSMWIRGEFSVSVIENSELVRTEIADVEKPIISLDFASLDSL